MPRPERPRTDNILKTVGGVVGVIAFFVIVRKVVFLTGRPTDCSTRRPT